MKRNTFMKRLAVTALAATMTLGTVPVTAISTFAANSAEATNADVNTDDDAHKALETAVSAAVNKVTGLTKDSTAADLQSALETALGSGYVVAVKADTYKVGAMDENNVVPITATVSVTQYNGETIVANGEYDVEVDVKVTTTSFTNQQRVDTVSKDVQKYLNSYKFAATGTPTASEVKKVIDDYLNGASYANKDLLKTVDGKGKISYTVAVDASKSTESTQIQRGTVAGTVTFSIPKVDEDKDKGIKADNAATASVDFSSSREFNTAALTSDKVDTIKNYLEAATTTYENDATATDIANDVNDYIKKLAEKDNTWNGITASVGELTRVDTQAHKNYGKDAGSFRATLTLTDGTSTLADTFDGHLTHSKTEMLDEVDKAITAEAGKYSVTKIQKANATTPASNDTVEAAVTKILNNAIDEKIDDVKVSNDGWKVGAVSVPEGTLALSYTKSSIYKEDKDTLSDVIVASVDYTKATSKAEGKVEVTAEYAKGEGKDQVTKETTFTLTLPKLKAQADTYLRFDPDSVDWKYEPTAVQNDNAWADDGKQLDENSDGDNTYSLSSLLKRNGNDELVWSSSNPDVVVVDADGNVVLKGVGQATVTVTDADNSKVTASIEINADEHYVFADVQDSNKYYFSPVYWAKRNDITSGVTDNEFGVGQGVTRAQMVTWLWKEAGKPSVAAKNSFTDVSENAFYAKAVDWAVSQGITSGKTATTFAPNETVTRGQMVQFLYKEFGKGTKYNANRTADFTDVSEKAFYYDAVQWAVKNGVTAGKTVNKFAPNDTCTREQGVTFLYKASRV